MLNKYEIFHVLKLQEMFCGVNRICDKQCFCFGTTWQEKTSSMQGNPKIGRQVQGGQSNGTSSSNGLCCLFRELKKDIWNFISKNKRGGRLLGMFACSSWPPLEEYNSINQRSTQKQSNFIPQEGFSRPHRWHRKWSRWCIDNRLSSGRLSGMLFECNWQCS